MEKAPINISYIREIVTTILEYIFSWSSEIIGFMHHRIFFFIFLPFILVICFFGIKHILYLIHSSR